MSCCVEYHIVVQDTFNRVSYCSSGCIQWRFVQDVLISLIRTVQRIKRLIAGREAYIVPGLVNEDDITVADILGQGLIPVPD